MPAPKSSTTPSSTTTPSRNATRVTNVICSEPSLVAAQVLDQQETKVAKLHQLLGGESVGDGGLVRHRLRAHRVDALQACFGDESEHRAAVLGIWNTLDQAVPFQDIDDVGHRSRRHVHAVGERAQGPVSYTHLRAHETRHDLVCR